MDNIRPESGTRQIIRYKNGNKTLTEDIIVTETNFNISVQCEVVGTITCTPSHTKELTVGYLVTSGIVSKNNKLIHLEYIEGKKKYDVSLENNNILKEKEFSVFKPLGCGSGESIFIKIENSTEEYPQISIKQKEISELMKEFNKTSDLFRETGGVHSAALASQSGIIVFMEDIGRHNAVDKVVGALYLNKQDISDKVLLTSGRISSEIVVKSIYAGIQIIISRSAPTLKAIELAENNNITLIGFARADNFNIYSCFEKVVFD
ncbi:MAG TPA: formate dehydrogenase accessory sulfurtransferase FdhD [Bacteroidales bacterium]|nr:formate dehydrogenase accessory sulfurtransferase FdhD [Bacteroidales bacterium]